MLIEQESRSQIEDGISPGEISLHYRHQEDSSWSDQSCAAL